MPNAAADFEQALSGKAVKIDEARQMVQFVVTIGGQLAEKFSRTCRRCCDIEIVDMCIPIGADSEKIDSFDMR